MIVKRLGLPLIFLFCCVSPALSQSGSQGGPGLLTNKGVSNTDYNRARPQVGRGQGRGDRYRLGRIIG